MGRETIPERPLKIEIKKPVKPPKEKSKRKLRNEVERLKLEVARLKKKPAFPESFYTSEQWRKLRYEVIRTRGRVCQCCGASNTEIHVDHIKPRSKYPELALDAGNLQVLCRDCNMGKSNTDETDWRSRHERCK